MAKDPKDLKILAQDSNFNKMKKRMEFKLFLYDETGAKIAEASKMNTTLNKVTKELRDSIVKGEETAMFETSPTIMKLKKLGWTVKTIKSGRINSTSLKIIFRKSK